MTSPRSGEDKTPDVLPPAGNALMALLWILLFGGRWIGVPLLQAAGLVNAEQIALLDELVLGRVYLLLLAVTLIVLALRAVRRASPGG